MKRLSFLILKSLSIYIFAMLMVSCVDEEEFADTPQGNMEALWKIIDEGIRVTFDNQIVATESCFDIFSEHLNMNPILDPYDVVLEVKFNGFLLNYIQNMINCIDKSELSVSKYVLARQNAYQTHI